MQITGRRSLAWLLKWVADVAIVGWLVLQLSTLYFLAVSRAPGGPQVRQGSVRTELKLPMEWVQPRSADIEVINFQANQSYIHYRSPATGLADSIGVFSFTLIFFATTVWILWHVRQLLASLVHSRPLAESNASRFRIIGLILLFRAMAGPIWTTFGYLRLQELFAVIPHREFLELYLSSVSVSDVFVALLVVLMAEVARQGSEHRIDSEAIV